jgi:glycosyltransferase involved in cell wall biosynthesis
MSASFEKKLPKVTLCLAVLNEERDIARCLKSIQRQDYPTELIEVLVMDGGSTDRTEDIVKSFGFKFLHNPLKLAEPGYVSGYAAATGDLFVHLAADNELRSADWLKEMVRPFQDDDHIMGAYCRVGCNPGDNPFLQYFNSDTDPFSMFLYGNASHPETFNRCYPVKKDTGTYVVYQFDAVHYPLVAFCQGFMLRHSGPHPAADSQDDLVPVIRLLEKGCPLAYVRTVTIGHYIFDNFAHYRRRMLRKASESFTLANHGFTTREKALPWIRRFRQYLFIPWALLLVGPTYVAIRNFALTRKWYYFYHIPASFLLASYILRMFIEVRVLKIRKKPTTGYH